MMFEDLRRDPRTMLSEPADFLGFDPNPFATIDEGRK